MTKREAKRLACREEAAILYNVVFEVGEMRLADVQGGGLSRGAYDLIQGAYEELIRELERRGDEPAGRSKGGHEGS
jgi:hypothetical protein